MKNLNTLLFILILSTFINTGYGQSKAIKVEITGTGTPILFLPGFTTPGAVWKETVDHLKMESENHLISYAGFNGNEAIEMPWYKSIKEAIITYVENKELSEIIIIGHSMGGNLAIDIAAEIPTKVAKLIIVDSLPCMREIMMPGVSAESLSYSSPYNQNMIKMDSLKFKGMVSQMASYMTLKENKMQRLTKWMLEADRKTYVYGYTDLLKLDLRPILSKVKCETLILGASFPDVSVAKRNYEKQYSNLPNKILEMAPNSKHFIMFDQPEWFYKKVNAFVSNE